MAIVNATYKLYVDWDEDKDYVDAGDPTAAYNEVSEDVLNDESHPIKWSRGRARRLGGTSEAGTMEFTILDITGLYSPANVASPLYGYLVPGRSVKLVATYDGTDYVKFVGGISRIVPHPAIGDQNVYFYCEDDTCRLTGAKVFPQIKTQSQLYC